MPRQAVLFLIDTQGTFVLGSYTGNAALGTPHLDRLASEGVRFNWAYTCSPVCGPARSAIFTGLPPQGNGVLGNDMAPATNCPTLAQRLAPAGVACALIGKWHLDGSDYFGDGRCAPGWDPRWWFDGRNYLESLSPRERALSRRVLDAADVAAEGITSEFTHAHRIADRAIAFLEENRAKDFLLVVSIDEPHHPFIAPEPWASAFEDFELDVPNADDSLAAKPRQQREWAAHVAPALKSKLVRGADGRARIRHPRFFGCNSYSDHQVGRVLAAIDSLVPGALVIHTSDHGDMMGHHGLSSKGPTCYEEVARVPLLVRFPGVAPAGKITNALVSHLDLAPTLLDHFGCAQPPLLAGRSFRPVLEKPAAAEVNRHVFVDFNRFEVDHDGFGAFAPIRAVVDGRWKLAINLLDTDEFYDLRDDPHELTNRIDDPACTAERDRLHDVLLARMGEIRDPLRGPHWSRRSWRDLGGSTWGGPTRPRPNDPDFFPPTLVYDSGEPAEQPMYPKD